MTDLPLKMWIIMGLVAYAFSIYWWLICRVLSDQPELTRFDKFMLVFAIPFRAFGWVVNNLIERPLLWIITNIVNFFDKRSSRK